MARTKQQKQDAADSIQYLTDADGMNIKPGDRLYTSNHGSNGTYIKVFVIKPDSTGTYRPFNITWHVARALETKPRDKDGSWMIHNPVYGMDRGFDIVYNLSRVLFRDMPEEEIREINPNHGSADAGYLLYQDWL